MEKLIKKIKIQNESEYIRTIERINDLKKRTNEIISFCSFMNGKGKAVIYEICGPYNIQDKGLYLEEKGIENLRYIGFMEYILKDYGYVLSYDPNHLRRLNIDIEIETTNKEIISDKEFF